MLRGQPSTRIIRHSVKTIAWGALAFLLVLLVYFSIQTWVSRTRLAQRWAAGQNAAHTSRSLAGHWIGQWKSKGVGDGGDLKAIIWNEPGDDTWHAQFFADHYAIFQKNHELLLLPKLQPDGQWTFEGVAKLTEGEHEYSATCDGEKLELTWRSALDHGIATFEREAAMPEAAQFGNTSVDRTPAL